MNTLGKYLLLTDKDFKGKDTIYLTTGFKLTDFIEKYHPHVSLLIFLPVEKSDYICLVLHEYGAIDCTFLLDERIFDEGEILELAQKYADKISLKQSYKDMPLDGFQSLPADIEYEGPKEQPTKIIIKQMSNITLQPITTLERVKKNIYKSNIRDWNYRALSSRRSQVIIP